MTIESFLPQNRIVMFVKMYLTGWRWGKEEKRKEGKEREEREKG